MSKHEPDQPTNEDKILSGQAWDDFCDELKRIGRDVVMADTAPTALLDRAEGFRYLARLTRSGLLSFLDGPARERPEFRSVVGVSQVKLGMDNPDNVYATAGVRGTGTYRITCKRNTVHFLGFGSQAGGYGRSGNLETTGSFDASNISVNAVDEFEIIASATPQPGKNWLPMAPNTNLIQARQTFGDRNHELLPTLHIERIDTEEPIAVFDPAQVATALQGTTAFVRGSAELFAKWTEDFKSHTNSLPRFDPDIAYRAGGDPKIAYYHSYFDLAEDEALVVEFTPPKCEYWNFQLANYWLESLDYRYYQVHINQHTATYQDDGSVRIIISNRDPGTSNWLNTTGHAQGAMCARWLGASEHPVPQTKVVKFAAITAAANG